MTSVRAFPTALYPKAESIARPVMVQRWTDVVFLHWRYDPQVVQRLLPAGVTVDVFEGAAWIGLIPFRMEGLGLPGLAPLPIVGSFPEVNVRTYVRAGGRQGVWFFSLDTDVWLAAVVARLAYHLPYFYGRAEHGRVGEVVSTRVERLGPHSDPGTTCELDVRVGSSVDPGDRLVHFLTDRWGLVSQTRRRGLVHAAVDHPAWLLRHADVLRLDEQLVAAAGLPTPIGPAHALWSAGVDVRVGRPRRIGRRLS
jgi:uncharacterized protein